MQTKCNVCGNDAFETLIACENVPVCPNAPLSPDAIGTELISSLDIAQCRSCSHIFNKAFDEDIVNSMYDDNYSSGLPSKKVIEKFEHILADFITDENIRGKNVLEIGASDFTFSEMLLAHGAEQVLAFEPSNLFSTESDRIVHVQGFFSADAVPDESPPVDLIVIRHVLEHLTKPTLILNDMASLLAPGGMLYIEVPNADDVIDKNRFYDFFYEHINYYTPAFLSDLLKAIGFETVQEFSLVNGQHFGLLCRRIEGEPGDPACWNNPPGTETRGRIAVFKKESERILKTLGGIFNDHSPIAIYGAGNHAIYTTALLSLTSDNVQCMLDLNPLKSGHYTPSSHIVIQPPSNDSIQDLEAIVIIASLHQVEIHSDLRGKYGFKKKIFGTYPDVFEMD